MRVLVADDELSMREFLEVLLTRNGLQVTTAANFEQAKAALSSKVDLVITDMKLGQDSGLDVLRAARASESAPEVIVITAYGTPASAVEAMRQGAYDYIAKPFDNQELMLLVQKALEKRGLLEENKGLRDTLVSGGRAVLLNQSGPMRAVWALVDKVAAAVRSTVLITGESGTGKEVVARAIHYRSARAPHPFVPVNCGAITDGLLESELFGHVKGAFTGASSDREGILASAGEGTVLLDEIGELSLQMQVKLLRVLQEHKLRPVGSTAEKPFAARILAATNRSLDAQVKEGKFREDLFFRLNVLHIELPPLRDHREDVPDLARFFVERFSQELARPLLGLSPEALAMLQAYDFPGNVRQLENLIERAATLSEDDLLTPQAFPPAVRGEHETGPQGEVKLDAGFSLERFMDHQERRFLIEALKRAGGVKTKAAELLGLSFRSFRYRLAKHGLGDREPT
ncbi:MAG: sigma-54 dependent transcriptional regulator [Myxococcaceae bacterium]